MAETSAFTASLGHNGLIDIFAIGEPGNDSNGTAVFLAQAAPGQEWPPWDDLGKPGVGAIDVQSITGPDGYGHLLARSGDYHLWVKLRDDKDDWSFWTDLGVPPPAAQDDPMVFGWMSGATNRSDGTIDVVGFADSTRHGAGMFIRTQLNPAIPFDDWTALPENDSADGPIACIADDRRGLDIVTRVNNVTLAGEGVQSGLCHLRRRPDFTWTDWEMLDPVSGGFNQLITPVLAYGGGGEDLNLFAVAADNTVWHSVATADGWSPWLLLEDPGAPVTGISAVEDAAGQLNLFALRQDDVLTLRRQQGQAGAWWPWTGVPTAADLIDSYEVILDAEGCLNLLVARPGNQGIDTFRQQGPGGAFVPGAPLPVLPPAERTPERTAG
ncbi:MAG: hypothetical protein WAK82_01125 [Streptosporangiaceae bacterium]